MDGTPAAIADAKRALRRRVLASRSELPRAALDAAGDAIARAVLALPQVQAADVVAAYVATAVEVPTARLLDGLVQAGKTVLLPVLRADDSLSWRALTDLAHLVPGRRGLLEPPAAAPEHGLGDAQVVIAPGLCYDGRGRRLGRGGGSYDRALDGLAATVTAVGIALDADIVESLPVDSHDQPVHVVVTPTRVITAEDGGR
ncbi:MAG: 5-formyltetrahydrofolate cyclo-ligase [Frankiaceae bacterium]|nr:5-formyltetrahydrofolate cyclo-ligase [Frankiaceae bacterium]